MPLSPKSQHATAPTVALPIIVGALLVSKCLLTLWPFIFLVLHLALIETLLAVRGKALFDQLHVGNHEHLTLNNSGV